MTHYQKYERAKLIEQCRDQVLSQIARRGYLQAVDVKTDRRKINGYCFSDALAELQREGKIHYTRFKGWSATQSGINYLNQQKAISQ